jgi:CheY-like chemotaxis protein
VHLSFRSKLFLIVTVSATAILFIVVVSTVLLMRQAARLDDLERRLVPKLELGPKLESDFERLRRRMQDAVAAQDPEALAVTIAGKDALIAELGRAEGVIAPADAASLRHAIAAYHATAYDVSQRMIRGEAGEALAADIEEMHRRQNASDVILRKVGRLDRRELRDGFDGIRTLGERGHAYRIGIGALSLALVLWLSLWAMRGALDSLSQISRGFGRFAIGNFTEPIVVSEKRELGVLAREANEMAANLERLATQRDRDDWLKTGLAALSDELRGELEPEEAAGRAMRYIAERLEAPAAAIYWSDDGRTLRRVAARASTGPDPVELRAAFRIGEGLVGEAARADDITVVRDPPGDYLQVTSGLGGAAPRSLVFVPFARNGQIVAVLELALFKPYSEADRELLVQSREMLAVGFDAARSRSSLRRLLSETQALAEQLAAQEEELRANNEELSVKQQELVHANDELEAQRRELSEQNVELEEARERIEQKAQELAKVSSYKSQFLANMSHELRTPLNSMLLLSHLLADNEGKNLTAKQVEHCRTIHSSGKDLLGLINQVLDLAKIEAGKQELALEAVSLDELARYVERVFRPLATDKGVDFAVSVDSDLPRELFTDKQRLERILINLLGNAVKFTERGTVSLAISRPPATQRFTRSGLDASSAVAFAVSDTGIGVPFDARSRIFAPFEQVEGRADRRYGGTGLGLSIALESVTLLGGELALESSEGKGSTFTVYLPIPPPTSAERPAPRPPTPPAQARVELDDDRHNLRRSEPRLLVIEDDPTFAEHLLDIIRSRRFKALVGRTAEEGLALARETHPSGIILDVKLPDLDGWTVMERLRHDPATRTIPVHFISAVDAPERALALGAVGYLTKPVSRSELIGVVQTLMRAVTDEPGRVLVVEDDLLESESLLAILRDEKIEALHVGSAALALEALRSERFGCVVLDLGLPDMDGLGLLETLRSNGEIDAPPVLVHTGRSLTRDETRRIEAYAEAIVLKDGNSSQRLLDEIRLFVQRVRDELPSDAVPRRPPAVPDLSLAGTKILLADDDMRTVYALSALLRGKGADVLVAETGREALETLAKHPDVNGVLMDVMMPEMDGYEAMRLLRREQRFAKLPVLALTARAMKGERERCLEAGASDYLSKPVDPERLLAALKSWLSSGDSR